MRFDYNKFEGDDGRVVFRPYVPVVVSYKDKSMRIEFLADTGADRTILPLEVAEVLKAPLDIEAGEKINGAGGGTFMIYESLEPIEMCIEAQKGFRPIQWSCRVCFAKVQPTPLFGYKDCLERLNAKFLGAERVLEITKC